MVNNVYCAQRIPSTLNVGLALLMAGLAFMLLFGIPLALTQGYTWAYWLVIPCIFAIIPHWALIHEAIHSNFHAQPSLNTIGGRVLGVLFLSPFHVLGFGHLSHHKLNAEPACRSELYDPQRCSRLRAISVFYPFLICGFYLVEVASGIMTLLLPHSRLRLVARYAFYGNTPGFAWMADRAERKLLEPTILHQIRSDALAIVILLGMSIAAYGTAWPLLVLGLLGRAFLISLMDNAPHYGGYTGKLSDPLQGYNMYVMPAIASLILNSNLHGTHHRHPNLPWIDLPLAFNKEGGYYAGSYLRMPWWQFYGPIPYTEIASENVESRNTATS